MNVANLMRASVWLVENCVDGIGDYGLLQPALQPLRVLLRKNALAGRVGHRKAATPQDDQQSVRRLLGAPFGNHLSQPFGTSLGASLGTSLREILLREIALVFVALHNLLQRAASRLIQGIVREVTVEL